MKRTAKKALKAQAKQQKKAGAAAPGSEVRRFPVRRWISVGLVIIVVFVIAGGIGSLVRSKNLKKFAAPVGAGGKGSLAIPVTAHAPVDLTVYEDMRDPASLAFAKTYDSALAQLVASGTANVYYREIAGEDATQGGTGSLKAGNALGCASDAGSGYFAKYRKVLLENQPPVTDDAYASNATLSKLAGKVKKLDTDVFRSCLSGANHKVWVQTSTKTFTKAELGNVPVLTMSVTGVSGVRTLVGNGSTVSPTKLISAVVDAAKVAHVSSSVPTLDPSSGPSTSASPSPSASTDGKKHKTSASDSASPSASSSDSDSDSQDGGSDGDLASASPSFSTDQ